MNEHQLKVTGRILPISEATKRLNPDIFGVGGLGVAKRKHDPQPALDKDAPKQRPGAGGVVIGVSIISFRRRLLDDDNNIAGNKHLRDCIAESLNLDDADPRITWDYHQIATKGQVGTLVRIQINET